MWACPKCHELNVEYSSETKTFTCPDCNYKEKKEGRKQRCPSCHTMYVEYTWFDPSGCPKCMKSFVD